MIRKTITIVATLQDGEEVWQHTQNLRVEYLDAEGNQRVETDAPKNWARSYASIPEVMIEIAHNPPMCYDASDETVSRLAAELAAN